LADEQTTDATNSAPAIQTDAAAATDTTTSTTEGTTPPTEGQQGDAEGGDALDDAGGLAAVPDASAAGDESGEEGEPQGGEDGEEGEQKPSDLIGAPEGDYEPELPDGVALDPEGIAEIAPLARELNLSNKGFGELAAKGIPIVERAVNKAMVESVVAQRKAWETDGRAYVQGGSLSDGTAIEASPVFAGENMDAVMTASAKAIDRFTTDANGAPLLFPNAKVNTETGEMEPGTFRDFLKTTGLGNHPAMLFAFYRAGKAIGEDSDFERHGATPQTKLSREAKYYPHRQTT
jgi:hypothetical protein